MKKTIVWIAIIALIGIIAVVVASSLSTESASSIDAEKLAQHLTDSGAKLYGAEWCSACKAQKNLFGDAADLLPYVECSDPTNPSQMGAACVDAKIGAYPTWIFADGSREVGVVSLNELAELTDFE